MPLPCVRTENRVKDLDKVLVQIIKNDGSYRLTPHYARMLQRFVDVSVNPLAGLLRDTERQGFLTDDLAGKSSDGGIIALYEQRRRKQVEELGLVDLVERHAGTVLRFSRHLKYIGAVASGG